MQRVGDSGQRRQSGLPLASYWMVEGGRDLRYETPERSAQLDMEGEEERQYQPALVHASVLATKERT